MEKKCRILYSLLIMLVILFVGILYFVINRDDDIYKYDEYKVNKISKYLEVNSMYYDGIQESLKSINDKILIKDIDFVDLNRQIASYVITNVVSNSDYGYDECNVCYRYFSKDDNIRFYDTDIIDNIYKELFNDELRKITQEDIIDFNIIYYNEEIDKYYINVVYEGYKPEIIFKYKDYGYEDDMLYIDYYYSDVLYDTVDEDIIYLYNMNNIMMGKFNYNDLYNEDNIIINYKDYVSYFDIVRYVFKYDYDNKKYLLDEIKRIYV